MSDDEERSRNENQSPKDKEEKKKTLADATHLLKAKALQQYAEKQLRAQSGKGDRERGGSSSRPSTGGRSRPTSSTGGGRSRPTSGGETSTGRLKSAKSGRDTISGSFTADERPEGQGSEENGHSSQVKPNTTGGRLDESQTNINNSKLEIGDLGDGLIEREAKDSGPKDEKTNIVHASGEGIEKGESGKFAQGVLTGDQEGGGDIALDEASSEVPKSVDDQKPDSSTSNSTDGVRSDGIADGTAVAEEGVRGSKERQRMDGDSVGQVVEGESEESQNMQAATETDSKVDENKASGTVADSQDSSEQVKGGTTEGIKKQSEIEGEEGGLPGEEGGLPGGGIESQAITESQMDSSGQEITGGNLEQNAGMKGSTLTLKTTGAAAIQDGEAGSNNAEQKNKANANVAKSADKAGDGDASAGVEGVTPDDEMKDGEGKGAIENDGKGKRRRGKSMKTRAGDESNGKEWAASDIEVDEDSEGDASKETTDSQSEIANGGVAAAGDESGANGPTESTSSSGIQGEKGCYSISGASLETTGSAGDQLNELESSGKGERKARAKKMKERSVDVIEGLDLSEDPAKQSVGVKFKKSRKQDSPKPEQKPEEDDFTEEEESSEESESETKVEEDNAAEVVVQEEVDHGGLFIFAVIQWRILGGQGV